MKKAKALSKTIEELKGGRGTRYFKVKSKENEYTVSLDKDGEGWCDCRKFSLYMTKNGDCSHIISVKLKLGLITEEKKQW